MLAKVSHPGAIADPTTVIWREVWRPAIQNLEAECARLTAERDELRARLLLMERAALPAPLRTEHAQDLLDQAANGAKGSTPDAFLADVWNRFMALLDGSFEWDALAAEGVHRE